MKRSREIHCDKIFDEYLSKLIWKTLASEKKSEKQSAGYSDVQFTGKTSCI